MTLTADQLESVFRREHEFRAALVTASKAAQPKPPSIWSGVGKLLLKSIPANMVRDAIVGGGKAILANRGSAGEDQPVLETKRPAAKGPSKERYDRSGITFVGTLDEPKPVPRQ